MPYKGKKEKIEPVSREAKVCKVLPLSLCQPESQEETTGNRKKVAQRPLRKGFEYKRQQDMDRSPGTREVRDKGLVEHVGKEMNIKDGHHDPHIEAPPK